METLRDVCISGKPEYEIMQTAWRERNPGARIKAAKDAIGLNPECATAYILLAEEEVRTEALVVTTLTLIFSGGRHHGGRGQVQGSVQDCRDQLPSVPAAPAPEPTDGVPAPERHQRHDLHQAEARHVRPEAWKTEGSRQDV